MKNLTETESVVRVRLEELKPVPPRDPRAAARGRARFLALVADARAARRQNLWGFIFRKQQFAMNFVVSILVIAALLAGGGTTVYAAQDDLPNEPLYGVKIWSEDVSLQLERSPEARVERLMELSQTRIQEMTRLVESGQDLPERVALRLERHLEQSLQICSTLDEAALDRALTQVRDQLQKQEHDLQALETQAGQGAQPILEHARSMLQTQLYVVNDGLLDHQTFRETVHNGLEFAFEETRTPTASVTPTPQPEQSGQATPPPDNSGNSNSNGWGPDNNPSNWNAHVTPTPKTKETKETQELKPTKEPKESKTKDPKIKEPNENKPEK